MRWLACFGMCVVVFGNLMVQGATPTTAPAAAASLPEIVRGLGDADFGRREAAQRELANIPAKDMWLLYDAAEASADPEVKARLGDRMTALAAENLWVQAGLPPREFAARLTGRLVDGNGKPMARVAVNAGAATTGFGGAERDSKGESDKEGRFEIAVPFAGILYTLSASPEDVTVPVREVVADGKPLGDWVLKPIELVERGVQEVVPHLERVIKGVVVDQNGQPVPRHAVELIGGYGNSFSATTDEQGRFSIKLTGGYLGQGVPLVREGRLVVPVTMVSDPMVLSGLVPELRLTLGPAAAVKGVVRDSAGPVAGATVRIKPNFACGLELKTRTDASGAYRIEGVPPGAYIVTGDSPAHVRRPPRSFEFEIPPTALQAGQTATVDLMLERMAMVAGQVVNAAGKPEAGAVVSVQSNFRDSSESWATCWTDQGGHFLLGTARSQDGISVYAFSGAGGLRTTHFEPMRPGTLRTLRIQLPGTVKITGTVTGTDGKPVEDVWCTNAQDQTMMQLTGEDGQFDLGLVSRGANGDVPAIEFRAARPSSPGLFNAGFSGGLGVDVEGGGKARAFFQSRTMTPEMPLPAGGMRVVLEPTELLSITGVALDSQGQPLPATAVYLFSGTADETWVNQANPGGGLVILPEKFRMQAGVLTDKEGHFTFRVLRHEALASETGVAMFSVGLYTKEKSELVTGVQVPKAANSSSVTVRLKGK